MREYIKNILGSGRHSSSTLHNKTLIISNDEIKGIIEIVKSLEDSCLLLKGIAETIRNKAKEEKGGFLSMLLDTLGAGLLGNILEKKGAIPTIHGQGMNRAGERTARGGFGNKKARTDF